jgi:hypothetical protein
MGTNANFPEIPKAHSNFKIPTKQRPKTWAARKLPLSKFSGFE